MRLGGGGSLHGLRGADVMRDDFQTRVQPWMMACFGAEISGDREERNHWFLEEALELVQACGATRAEAHQLVDYVFGRAVGEPMQEAGGVMVTLAALCLANGFDLHRAGEKELARIWTKIDQIRAKQAGKPKHSSLPTGSVEATETLVDRLATMLAEVVDTPLLVVREDGHRVELRVGSFNQDLGERAAGLLLEVGL